MSALQDRRAELLDALYEEYGEPAAWAATPGGAGVPVTVRRNGQDVEVGYGSSSAVVWRDLLKVRASELAAPKKGAVVTLPDSGETLKIIADPQRMKGGLEWACETGPVRT